MPNNVQERTLEHSIDNSQYKFIAHRLLMIDPYLNLNVGLGLGLNLPNLHY